MKKLLFLFIAICPLVAYSQDNPLQLLLVQIQKEGAAGWQKLQQKIGAGKATPVDYLKAALIQGENEGAMGFLTTAINKLSATSPYYKEALLLRSNAWMRQVNIDSAMADLRRVRALDPKETAALINLSYLAGTNGDYRTAVDYLQVAATIDSADANIFANMAYYYAEGAAYDSAGVYGAKALNYTKDAKLTGTIMNTIGYAQGMSVSRERGLAIIRKSLEIYPENSFAWFNIGRIYMEMNNRDEACEAFRRAKSLGGVNLTAEYLESYCQ
ncbi:Flp pilus assembly protein TadD, contains TPR repeats [Chitinophaga jiangningensis]|uniref:Flp pilus assembly protein TadD, contains TPR repeats n=1 Tax=Chitinophaga jiangningensis TaxID=1419482 RepID=A0A1M6YB86_9BACT|nr:tetratricopeptide repeat protein [Chitinophaga jiangningensis]SHL15393.1 Flp pilus assembly protein TadD, contains TPR repeats [Chitinophaga jiangningensis]